jgi:hypothetical protein
MASATITALFVQWGTSGAAILISYLTPGKGLGCRSGAYVTYGSLGTVSWLLLVFSLVLSHAAMLRYQHAVRDIPSVEFMKRSGNSSDPEWQQHNNNQANGHLNHDQ